MPCNNSGFLSAHQPSNRTQAFICNGVGFDNGHCSNHVTIGLQSRQSDSGQSLPIRRWGINLVQLGAAVEGSLTTMFGRLQLASAAQIEPVQDCSMLQFWHARVQSCNPPTCHATMVWCCCSWQQSCPGL